MFLAIFGISSVDPHSILDHFDLLYANMAGGSKARRSFMDLIWFTCVWVIWQERNNKVFNFMEKIFFPTYRFGKTCLFGG